MISTVVILRRQWEEKERPIFPIVQVPLSLFLVLFDVFSHFHLERHLQHPSRPFPDEVLQIRLHFGPDYALHLNCRIFSHERILSPSFSREFWVDWT